MTPADPAIREVTTGENSPHLLGGRELRARAAARSTAAVALALASAVGVLIASSLSRDKSLDVERSALASPSPRALSLGRSTSWTSDAKRSSVGTSDLTRGSNDSGDDMPLESHRQTSPLDGSSRSVDSNVDGTRRSYAFGGGLYG